MPFGNRWKRHRRAFDRPLRESQVHVFWDIQQDCARRLLVDLAKSPKDFMSHLRLYVDTVSRYQVLADFFIIGLLLELP